MKTSGMGKLGGKPSAGAVILAGGKSERMGVDKARLPWLDGKNLLERMAGCLRHLDEALISVGSAEPRSLYGLPAVADLRPGQGPIGGLHSALLACRSDWLLAVSCDMPLFERELADYLISKVCGAGAENGAILTMTRDERIHPLCGLYSKRMASLLESLMASGRRSVMDAARTAGFLSVSLSGTRFPDEMLTNVNTPGEYAALLSGRTRPLLRRPPLIAVCGLKKSGKTTLLEGLIPALTRKGLRIAAVKHDGHDFIPDVPRTDSFRLKSAGAFGVAVYSRNRWMAVKDAADTTAEQMAEFFPDADLILLEGGKSLSCPKIETVRNGALPVCDASALLALCVNGNFSNVEGAAKGIPVFLPNDYEGIAGLIVKKFIAPSRGADGAARV
jgi:molybdopterin-guanine dinucleotide biosynthesis protein MobB